jgi:transketolase
MLKKEKDILQQVANTVRVLSADAIEKQKSGHPGLPLGAAEIATYIYSKAMRHNPENPDWKGRDRFVLSAGHGSMLQYALLHLSGYDISIDDIKNFRQLHSKTPGHPEYGVTAGVETTTGPLGQGVATAVGMAIAQKFLGDKFGKELFAARIFTLAGDGCLMEGISAEACSLAGTLGLNNLILVYDSNDICLDGPTDECFSENLALRYEAYGFNVSTIDGYDFDQMKSAFDRAKRETEKPSLIIAKTVIGKYTPDRQGTSASHGAFLGEKMEGFKKNLNWTLPPFEVPDEVREFFSGKQSDFTQFERDWNEKFERIIRQNADLYQQWQLFEKRELPADLKEVVWNMDITPDQPTRKYNETLIRTLADQLPFLISGSADVASVDYTWLKEGKLIQNSHWGGQQIKFGVREFAMAASAYGMSLHGMVSPVIGTFLVFSDYMRNAIRMTAMMKQRVIYIFTHDSILIGQDGPTHQPVEHLMTLRLIPGLTVLRPGDENEARAAWITALEEENGPVAICFTRQPVKSCVNELTGNKAREGFRQGAYLLYGSADEHVNVEIFASGSEINTAYKACRDLEKSGYSCRLISVPSWELFDRQDRAYREGILTGDADLKVSVEAGVASGWQKFIGMDGLSVSQEDFGESAPEAVIADHFGFTAEKVVQKIVKALNVTNK